jgi:DNA-binding NarL/FixJ family response regulator
LTRVFICIATRLYREGLAHFLAEDGRLQVAGAAPDVATTLGSSVARDADLLLVDVGPHASGVRGLRRLAAGFPGAKPVALAIEESTDVVACAEAGARGYVTRDASLEELVTTLEAVGRDELVCTPTVAAVLMRRVGSLARISQRDEAGGERRLTARQLEVALLVERGLSNKQIARELTIELATVKNHVHGILDRLELSTRTEIGDWLRTAQIQQV